MISASLKVFSWLLWRDVRVLKKDFINSVIDAMIMPATFIIIAGYVLPYLGMPADYGAFMIVSSIVMMAYATANWRGAAQLVGDIEGVRSISYELTLPLPPWLVFVKIACAYAVDAMFLNILTLPLGKLLLWDKFSLAQFSIGKFVLIYLVMNLFFGFYSLWIASWVNGSRGFARFYLRYGSQLLFFSGFQFSWGILREAVPWLAYINIANPFVYAFEGARAAVLGQTGSLNFWLCLVMLCFFVVLFAVLANKNFKKRLDCL